METIKPDPSKDMFPCEIWYMDYFMGYGIITRTGYFDWTRWQSGADVNMNKYQTKELPRFSQIPTIKYGDQK